MPNPPRFDYQRVQQMQTFVTQLELEDFHSRVGTGAGHCNVIDGSLAATSHEMTEQQVQDVTDSTLLAQLAANKKFNRFEDPENWYKFYMNVLSNIGWTLESFRWNEYKSSQASFKLSQVTLELLSSMVKGEAAIMNVVKAAIDALATSKEGVSLYDSCSTSGDDGNFQVLPACINKMGQICLPLLRYHFKADRHVNNFFFFSWGHESISLFYATQKCVLNEKAYSKVRKVVADKEADKIGDYVKHLF